MDRYSIFAQHADKPSAAVAECDLDAALQLLADRAQYLTGASGVSIGLRSGSALICRASLGPNALKVGAPVPSDSALMSESLRRRQIVYCDDAAKGTRASREHWRELGIRSVMVGPLLREEEVVGVFELLAERDHAFADQDAATLQRLSDLMVTAMEQFPADGQPPRKSLTPVPVEAAEIESAPAAEVTVSTAAATSEPAQSEPCPGFKVQSCQSCGFPVSALRTLCVDCEEAQLAEQAPAFSWQRADRNPGWLQSHLYTMGTLLVAALTVVLLVLKLR